MSVEEEKVVDLAGDLLAGPLEVEVPGARVQLAVEEPLSLPNLLVAEGALQNLYPQDNFSQDAYLVERHEPTSTGISLSVPLSAHNSF